MFNFDNATLQHIVVHGVGNKQREEKLQLSNAELYIDESIKGLLHKYFLSPFKEEAFYHFEHETNLDLNEVYNYATSVFEAQNELYVHSVNIARHLYEQGNHPKIKGGEFYVALFKDCVIDDELCDALGLFKSETKETYLKVYQRNNNFEIEHENGININKLDKGCLIFNTEKESGYKVCIVDKLNKAGEAQFWKDDFLKLKIRSDDFYHTNTFLDVCKNFVNEVYNEENNVDRTEQIDVMNKSLAYFNEHDFYDKNEFEAEVMGNNPEKVKAFNEYKQQYQTDYDIDINEEFSISENAVKKQKKFFKSVIKLDKNFHIYVHGDSEQIAKGFDAEKQLNFYTLYYENES